MLERDMEEVKEAIRRHVEDPRVKAFLLAPLEGLEGRKKEDEEDGDCYEVQAFEKREWSGFLPNVKISVKFLKNGHLWWEVLYESVPGLDLFIKGPQGEWEGFAVKRNPRKLFRYLELLKEWWAPSW
ncbi:hypothetical protein [Thermus sp.]|uniref:hypothetical protein n=1 Tax=Thermus sp. TaxID=275 RepID=UPI003D09F502